MQAAGARDALERHGDVGTPTPPPPREGRATPTSPFRMTPAPPLSLPTPPPPPPPSAVKLHQAEAIGPPTLLQHQHSAPPVVQRQHSTGRAPSPAVLQHQHSAPAPLQRISAAPSPPLSTPQSTAPSIQHTAASTVPSLSILHQSSSSLTHPAPPQDSPPPPAILQHQHSAPAPLQRMTSIPPPPPPPPLLHQNSAPSASLTLQQQQGAPPTTPTSVPGLLEDDHRSVASVTGGVLASVAGVMVRSATVERLIQMCVEAFTEKGVDKRQEEFVTVFFLMHQWFMTSEELAQAFIDLYQGCEETITCSMVACPHLPINTDCSIQVFKKMICQAVRHWITKFPLHFDMDARVTTTVKKLSSFLQAEGNYKLKELVDVSKVPSYDWMRNMSVRNTVYGKHSRKVSLVFNHLEPKELASQLTYLEYKAFRRVHFSDYKNYAVSASLKDQPKLERSIALFNGLSQWVQCMVLSKTTPQQRADVICKFIDVSKHLRTLQNFNTLMAIVGGLSHSALARLSKTIGCLPPESQKTLVDLTELLSSNNNFSNYRKVYHQCNGFKIPILGVHLKDLISLHTALPDRVEGNLLNFRKMAQLAVILRELTRLQGQDNIPVDANLDLVNTLRLSLDMYHTEDEIYELSLAREPKGSLSSPTTPTKPVVFADWLSGISPPDKDTINKHVHDMVEAVFKNYDHDKDGFISHEEFDSIAGNFPFIDSFCVLDADKDGMISKREMKSYFIRANSHALRNSFKHAFHETTYFKPTFCIHCTGLLWGLIKQGWKCKDCGINAHKHCKDLVVMECRSKGSKRTESMSNGVVHQDLTISAKRKISQRHRQQRQRPSPSHTPPQNTPPPLVSHPHLHSNQSQPSASPPQQCKERTAATTASSPSVSVAISSSGDLGQEHGTPTVRRTSSLKVMNHHKSVNNSSSDGTSASATTTTTTGTTISTSTTSSLSNKHSSSSSISSNHSYCQTAGQHNHRECSIIDGEYYEEQALLYERLLKAEEAREKLIEENKRLRLKLDMASDQITLLKSHIGVIRQNTIAFILEQMDALHMQRDTEV
ncbi:ras guanyl-releasing protein 3 [Plakobranchus ocellatus]|uniref:Ras guanyl-releasing protein 3 n=1 Tax=Plakobranchus ocellatus TaxID=259542 RepID=A0AAV4CHF2_9GAST|nr:ras guanyl-releasing protein 3 [Plakobranchus ocellatus]